MTTDTDRDPDRALESFFEAARGNAPEPTPDLLARVLADAYAEQAAADRTAGEGARAAVPRRRRFRGLLDAIGGWPAFAGLAAAAMSGVWIGFNPPAALDTLAAPLYDSAYGLSMDSSLPSYDFLLADG